MHAWNYPVNDVALFHSSRRTISKNNLFLLQYITKQHHKLQANKKVQFIGWMLVLKSMAGIVL